MCVCVFVCECVCVCVRPCISCTTISDLLIIHFVCFYWQLPIATKVFIDKQIVGYGNYGSASHAPQSLSHNYYCVHIYI